MSDGQVALFDVGEPTVTPALAAKIKRAAKAAEKKAIKDEEEKRRGEAHGRVIAAYDEAYTAARGVRPIIGAAEGASVKLLLDTLKGDEARAIRIVREVYTDPFYQSRIGVSIRTIAGDPAKFERGPVRASRPAGRHQQAPSSSATARGRVVVNDVEDL